MSDAVRVLGPESPFSSNAKPGEGEQFTRDAWDHENEGRFEIDAFRYARYRVLGWIRPVEAFPYYELTMNGGDVCRKFYWRVAKQTGWDWCEDWYDDGEE